MISTHLIFFRGHLGVLFWGVSLPLCVSMYHQSFVQGIITLKILGYPFVLFRFNVILICIIGFTLIWYSQPLSLWFMLVSIIATWVLHYMKTQQWLNHCTVHWVLIHYMENNGWIIELYMSSTLYWDSTMVLCEEIKAM